MPNDTDTMTDERGAMAPVEVSDETLKRSLDVWLILCVLGYAGTISLIAYGLGMNAAWVPVLGAAVGLSSLLALGLCWAAGGGE